ncbi:MAG: SAM-dependent methyltransferase [Verrucomicrobia bacterium]|nr:SAM-dependent methyltransferase [Verrucomicrobiota bacterium]
MGSSVTPSPAPSAAFLALFRAHAAPDGTLPFAEFMRLALYDPALGYYRADRARVGYGPGTDFFTASTSAPVFGELVAAACVNLLRGRDPKEFEFVEIGAEPDRPVLRDVAHPFKTTRTIRVGEPLALTGPCIVFSNELFDAQPFRRFVFRNDGWHEQGVALRAGTLQLVDLPGPPADVPAGTLPASAPDGYVIDAPLASVALLREIAAQPWTGLFVACDYGKSWAELAEACPAGTARAYHRHTQSNDLLAQPGEQDLTCHICWDWLSAALNDAGFTDTRVDSQESFWVRQAERYIAQTISAEAARLSPRKLALMQLLHPAHLGQKFQVLHARRGI